MVIVASHFSTTSKIQDDHLINWQSWHHQLEEEVAIEK